MVVVGGGGFGERKAIGWWRVREVAGDLNIIRKAEAVEQGRSEADGRFKDYVDERRYGGPL